MTKRNTTPTTKIVTLKDGSAIELVWSKYLAKWVVIPQD